MNRLNSTFDPSPPDQGLINFPESPVAGAHSVNQSVQPVAAIKNAAGGSIG